MTSPRAAVHIQSLQFSHRFFLDSMRRAYTNAQLTHTIAPSKTHILWSFGHLVWVYDGVAEGIGLRPALPPHYEAQFKFGTKPSTNVADYPTIDELVARANECVERLCARLATLSDEALAAPLPAGHPVEKFFPSVDLFLSMCPFHTGYHLGQVGLLSKSQGLPGLFPV